MHFHHLSFLLLLFAFICPTVASEHWYLLPNYQHNLMGIECPYIGEEPFHEVLPEAAEFLLKEDAGLTEAQKQELIWHGVRFPDRRFVELMPARNAYGWYACTFDMPQEMIGMDLLADLGLIDDTDECFLNGTRVGGFGALGRPNGIAWQTDRLYRIPAHLLAGLDNYLAVHVWNLWGLGGIIGPPVLKATPIPKEAQWEIAILKDTDVPNGSSLNSRQNLQKLLSIFPKPPVWRNASLPWQEFASWKEDEHYALFRISLDITSPFKTPVVLDAGTIFDVAAFFLNGKRVGLTGRFPDGRRPAFTEAAERAQFIVNPKDWSADGHNELVALIYRERGIGGLPGIPGFLLSNPLKERTPSFHECSEIYSICIQSGMMSEADKILGRACPQNDAEHAWHLSFLAHCAFLKWLDDGEKDDVLLDDVLAPLAEILAKYPVEAPRQSAMQTLSRILQMAERDKAVLRIVKEWFPKFDEHGITFSADRVTSGDWALLYGSQDWVFGGMGQKQDFYSGAFPSLQSSLAVPGGRDHPCLWLPLSQFNVSDRNAMSVPDSKAFLRSLASLLPEVSFPDLESKDGFSLDKGRIASWWDDHGEMHPFDDEGPDLLLKMNPRMVFPTHTPCIVTLHHQDYDWRNSCHPRQQSILLTDADGNLLNAVWLGKTDEGVYQSFLFEDSGEVFFRSIKHRGACVALTGFFVDVQPQYPAFLAEAKPDCDLHPVSLVQTMSGTLRLEASRLLMSCPGRLRCLAGRRFLQCNAKAAIATTQEELLGRALIAAIAADAAMGFWLEISDYRNNLSSMAPETLEKLLYHLDFFPCHPRWAFLAGLELLSRIPSCEETQAKTLLGEFAAHSHHAYFQPLIQQALEMWLKCSYSKEDPRYERLSKAIHGNSCKTENQQ